MICHDQVEFILVKLAFKGLGLVNSVPEELWIEVCNIVQEEANKTIPKKKKSKKDKWLSQEALQIAEERKAAKSKEERERYIQLNAEFQRIATRNKKSFFNEQCLKIEENNRREKTRDLLKKKNWQYQEHISPKDGHNKGQK